MPWYEWAAAAVLVTLLIAVIVYRIVRSTARGRRFLRLPTRAKLRFGRQLLSDPDVPLLAKVILGAAIGYLALPLDLIPDFIPVVGQLDDFFIVAAVVLLMMALVPKERFEAALAEAERPPAAREPPRSAALPPPGAGGADQARSNKD